MPVTGAQFLWIAIMGLGSISLGLALAFRTSVADPGGPHIRIRIPVAHLIRFVQNDLMDSVDHPLDWWAFGGYPAVMRELRCSKAEARHRVHQKIVDYYRRTGEARWRPIGNRGFAQLRRAIMAGRMLDNELR